MTTPLRVLVLEGHPAAAELVLSQLRQAGYEATWERVETQAEYLARLEPPPDLILADYRLPRFGAPAALRLLRQRGLDIPFIVVAGRIGELAAVECLKQGADDFLPRDCLGHLGPAVTRALERRRFGRAGANEAAMRESNLRLQQALTELQWAQQRIVEQERLRALGQMAGGIFHDFNNALAQVVGYAELLLTRPADLKDHDRSREYLGYILIAARDATAVVERLREFYRAREPGEAHRPIDLNPLVEAVVALTRPRWKDEAQARGAEMRVKTKLAASARVLGDESELREALTNLVFNALDAMPAGGTITIATRDAGNRGTPSG